MKFLPFLFLMIMSFQGMSQKSVNLFVLMQQGDSVAIEKIEIAENGVEIINNPDAITAILPLSVGLSGDFISSDRRDGSMLIAQNKGGELRIKYRDSNGTEKALPAVSITELQSFYIKVNVTGGNGVKKVFGIRENQEIEELNNPVMDMFGGKIPLGENDFAVTIETQIATVKKK